MSSEHSDGDSFPLEALKVEYGTLLARSGRRTLGCRR